MPRKTILATSTMLALLTAILCPLAPAASAQNAPNGQNLQDGPTTTPPTQCTYTTWRWHVASRQAQRIQHINKPYAQVSGDERHPRFPACSVCQQDQRTITLEGIAPFAVCHAVAAQIEHALRESLDRGFPIDTVIGYRVGRTRGPTDPAGHRTVYSNHAYGLAVDINPGLNGLYDTCPNVDRGLTPACRLIQGGPWAPDQYGSITPATPPYHALRGMGWAWGGELAGRQKDFMHFSPWGD